MIKHKFIPPDGSFGPLSPYVNTYLTQIKEQGYAVGSTYEQIYILKKFGCWLKRTGRDVQDANEAAASKFLGCSRRRGYGKNAARSTLRRLSAMLRQMGAMPTAITPRPRPPEQMLCAYEHYLSDERNLSQRTIAWHRRYVSRFLSEQFGGGRLNLSELRAPDVTEFVRQGGAAGQPGSGKKPAGGATVIFTLPALQGFDQSRPLAGSSQSGALVVFHGAKASVSYASAAGVAAL